MTVKLMIHYVPIDEQGNDDPGVMLVAPHQPLLHPDAASAAAGGIAVVPRVGETVTVRVRQHGQYEQTTEHNETWEVAQVHWTMSDISRSKATPTQVATLRMKRSNLRR